MEALFIKLLNMSITAGWLVLAVILLRFILKKAPKSMRCILWGIVGLRLIFPVSIKSALSLIPTAEPVPGDIIYPQSPTSAPVTDTAVNITTPPVSVDGTVQSAPSVMIEAAPTLAQRLTEAAAAVWLVGIAIMLIYMAVSYIRVRMRVRESISKKGNIFICDSISGAFILGVIRPRIYLPSNISESDADLIIAHERAHIRRLDHVWKPLGFLVLAIYWYNPILWLAYILLCRDIELACDEKVIKNLGMEVKKPYSQALLNCSIPRKMISACPLAFGEVGVKNRIRSVLSYKRPAFWIIIVSVIAIIATAVCFLTDPKGNDEPPQSDNEPPLSDKAPGEDTHIPDESPNEELYTGICDEYYLGASVYHDFSSSHAELYPIDYLPRYYISENLKIYKYSDNDVTSSEKIFIGRLVEVELNQENIGVLYNKMWQNMYENSSFISYNPTALRENNSKVYKVELETPYRYGESHVILQKSGEVFLVKGSSWSVCKLERI